MSFFLLLLSGGERFLAYFAPFRVAPPLALLSTKRIAARHCSFPIPCSPKLPMPPNRRRTVSYTWIAVVVVQCVCLAFETGQRAHHSSAEKEEEEEEEEHSSWTLQTVQAGGSGPKIVPGSRLFLLLSWRRNEGLERGGRLQSPRDNRPRNNLEKVPLESVHNCS